MKLKLLILIIGTAGGAALMHFFEAPVRQAVGLQGREVEASVLEERRDEDGRLVLMLESEGQSMLATFRERADDVASLVHVGDVVTFRAPVGGVFSDDVPLLSVRRANAGDGSEDGEELDEAGAEESDAEAAEAAEEAELDAEGAPEDAAMAEEPLEGDGGETEVDEAPQPVADAANPESDEPLQSAES